MSSYEVTITVRGHDAGLEVIDSGFSVIAYGFGELHAELEPGLYKARAKAAGAQNEVMFTVSPEEAPVSFSIDAPRFASAIPLRGTSTSQEYQQQAVMDISVGAADLGLGSGAGFMFTLRDASGTCLHPDSSPKQQENYLRSFDGFSLCDLDGNQLIDIDGKGVHDMGRGCLLLNVSLEPGLYVLTYHPDGEDAVDMLMPAIKGWQTQIFVNTLLPRGLEMPGHADLPERSLLMTPLGKPFDVGDGDAHLIELARHVMLQASCRRLPESLRACLGKGRLNPMLSLMLGYLLLLEEKPDTRLLADALDHLDDVFGEGFPDILALRLGLAAAGGPAPSLPPGGLPAPPLFRTGWSLIANQPGLFPEGAFLRDMAAHLVPSGIWLAWRPNQPEIVLTPIDNLKKSASQAYDLISSHTLSRLLNLDILHTARLPEIRLPASLKLPVSLKLPDFGGGKKTGRKSAGAKPSAADDERKSLALIKTLATDLTVGIGFRRLKSEEAGRKMLGRLSALQKGLLPTLQLIQAQLEGDDFTLDEFRQLRAGLDVPPGVFYDSLADFAIKVKRLKSELKRKRVWHS